MTCFGRQSSEHSFKCIIYDITKEYQGGHNYSIGNMAGFQKRGFSLQIAHQCTLLYQFNKVLY